MLEMEGAAIPGICQLCVSSISLWISDVNSGLYSDFTLRIEFDTESRTYTRYSV